MLTNIPVRQSKILFFFIFLLCSGLYVPAQAHDAGANAAIVKMIQGGLPESVIVDKIKEGSGKWDTSIDALLALKRAGASEPELTALSKSTAATTEKSTQGLQDGIEVNPKNKAQSIHNNVTEGDSWRDGATGSVWKRRDPGTDLSFDEAEDYCAHLPHQGHAMWRLPDKQELNEVTDVHSLSMMKEDFYLGDGRIFIAEPRTSIVAIYLKGSTLHGLTLDDNIVTTKTGPKPGKGRALCVYSDAAVTTSTVRDPETSLLWASQSMSEAASYEIAVNFCKALTLDGISGWRLPSLNETFPFLKATSSLRTQVLPQLIIAHSDSYWSSSKADKDGNEVWVYYPKAGTMPEHYAVGNDKDGLSIANGAICVRSAP